MSGGEVGGMLPEENELERDLGGVVSFPPEQFLLEECADHHFLPQFFELTRHWRSMTLEHLTLPDLMLQATHLQAEPVRQFHHITFRR
jgi:hypothetical protein